MILKMYTVYDSGVEAYMQPFYVRGNGDAIRRFSDTVNNKDHDFNKHPDHYTLFEIGSFDDNTCKFDLLVTPKSLGVAIDFKDS